MHTGLFEEVLTEYRARRLIGTLVDQMSGLASNATCPPPPEAGNWSVLNCNTPVLSTPAALGLPHCPERPALFALSAVSLPRPPPWLLGVVALAAAALAAVLVARSLAVFVGWLRRAVLLARLPHPKERAWLLGDLASMVRGSDLVPWPDHLKRPKAPLQVSCYHMFAQPDAFCRHIMHANCIGAFDYHMPASAHSTGLQIALT